LAGTGPRPGYEGRAGSPSVSPPSGARLRIIGGDGKELSPDEARAAMARRAASGAPRQPNTGTQASLSGPAGDHYSTVGDFLRLARALTTRKLLDSARTAAVLGQRYASGGDFRANGGGPGTNAEFSIFPSGEVM